VLTERSKPVPASRQSPTPCRKLVKQRVLWRLAEQCFHRKDSRVRDTCARCRPTCSLAAGWLFDGACHEPVVRRSRPVRPVTSSSSRRPTDRERLAVSEKL
jgi:hypothetical protein